MPDEVFEPLDFGNLPLLRVEYSVVFEAPVPPLLDEIARLREALKDDLPMVTDFSGGGPNLRVIVGAPAGVAFDDLDAGVGIAFREDRAFVAWQRLQHDVPYVRFNRLRELILKAVSAADPKMVASVVGSYINIVPQSHGPIHELICDSVFPLEPVTRKRATTVRLEWTDTSTHSKLQIYPVPEGYVLETACAIPFTESLETSLQIVRSNLYSMFTALITPKAKDAWNLTTP